MIKSSPCLELAGFSNLFSHRIYQQKTNLHQKLWKIYIIAFSKTLSKVSFISSPHCHKRSNKNVFLFPAKRPPHVLRYPHNSLLHLKQKKHFLLHFQGQCHGIYICQLSYKLARRIEIKLAAFPETLAGMRNQ